MRLRVIAILVLAPFFLVTGCHQPDLPPPAVAAVEQAPSGQPQARLPAIKLWLGAQEVIAEQAISPAQVQKGMMFRREMGENEGMLFIFARPHKASFWMRNTLLPLSCAYIDPSGVILEIRDMTPLDESAIEASSDQVQYVLEMNQGWFERNRIGSGTLVRTERGSLQETYFGRSN